MNVDNHAEGKSCSDLGSLARSQWQWPFFAAAEKLGVSEGRNTELKEAAAEAAAAAGTAATAATAAATAAAAAATAAAAGKLSQAEQHASNLMKRYAAQPPNDLAAGVGVNGWTSLLLDKHGGRELQDP